MNADTPNETHRSISTSFQVSGQDEVLRPYIAKYLDAANTAWEHLGTHKAAVALAAMFPRPAASPELLEQVDAWLESTEANPGAKRLVAEARLGIAPGTAFAPEAQGWFRWCFASKDPARLEQGIERLRGWLAGS